MSHDKVSTKVYLFNKDFNLLHKKEFDSPVKEMSYVKGVYYCRTDKVYCSEDFINWEVYDEGRSVPLYNQGNHVLAVKTDRLDYKFRPGKEIKIYCSSNGQQYSPVDYENRQIGHLSLCCDYFVSMKEGIRNQSEDEVSFSRDGIYWVDILLPEGEWDLNLFLN